MLTISLRALPFAVLMSLVCGLAGPFSTAFGQGFPLETPPAGLAKPLIQLDLGKPAAKPAGKAVEVKLTPTKGTVSELKPGDEVLLSLTVNVPEGSYTYSTTTPAGGKTRFEISKITGLEPASEDFQAEREPKSVLDPDFGMMEKYEKTITWTRPYRLVEGTALDEVLVEGTIRAQICDDATCRQLTERFQTGLLAKKAANAIVQKERPDLSGKPGPAGLTFSLEPQNAKPGENVTLSVAIAVDDGWHTYSITQPKVIGASATAIQIEGLQNLKPLGKGFTPSEPFETKTVDLGVSTVEHEVHHGTIVWSRDYEVLAAAGQAGFGIKGALEYQTCNASRCFPKTVAFDLQSKSPGVASQGTPSPETAGTDDLTDDSSPVPSDSRRARLEALLGAQLTSSGKESPTPGSATDDAKGRGLLWFIVAAVVAGFGALLTPCVYPMVPITISFFLKQSEKQHHRPMTLALVYCGGIIATFTGLGLLISALFEATDLNRLANNVWLNLMLTFVIGFFGISMLGMFEIRVPSWLLTWSAGKEQKGGIIGTLFMALTFTLVSFTCTFAFAGGLLVMASKGEVFWPIVGMLAFSGAFAFPFFLLALFPKMLAKLPKSGGWMNIIKVSMGFLEIGAALKFLSVADAIWFGQPTFLPYGVVMGAWFVLAVLGGLYPLGLYRMPHDTPGKFTLGRLAFGAPFLALAAMLGTALFTPYQPSGWVWDNVAAFAPPRFEGGSQEKTGKEDRPDLAEIGPYLEHDNLVYALDFFQALDYARRTNQPLFIDFTGQNCINCRKMELTVLPQLHNRERLEKFVRVQLFMDQIPLIEDEAEREWLLTVNRKLQEAFIDVTLPGYVVLNPHDVAENGRLKWLSYHLGMEQNKGQFADFLDKGLQSWQQLADEGSMQTAARIGNDAQVSRTHITAQRQPLH